MVVPSQCQGPGRLATLGMSVSEYRRRLIAIAVRPEAMAYDPLTVRRIRRRLVPSSRAQVVGR
ncbi:DUF3263 domain-containing protein [Pedococcus bigeumensis]|uniref:DUF3263 domain-containing protein n=1 Tax=Pedococcus bigeumensis TaxID=433644 RepID=A0A502CKW0_9MICO|nr:DUF3263 domain-containing protein [Pedococcus bigeumensis]